MYREILEHLLLSSTDELYGDADVIFQQDLAATHSAKGSKTWFSDHVVPALDWPESHSESIGLSSGGR